MKRDRRHSAGAQPEWGRQNKSYPRFCAAISRKWYDIRAKLLLMTNTQLHISHSHDTSHSATDDIHSVHISPSPDINTCDDPACSSSAVFSEQWACSPQKEQFMQSFVSTDSEVKAKLPRRSSTIVQYPYIYVLKHSRSHLTGDRYQHMLKRQLHITQKHVMQSTIYN